VELEPSIRYILNTQWFDDDQEHRDHQNLKAYEASVRISTTLDRIYDCEFMNAKRLKHRIRPTLSYIYRDFQDGKDESPWFESIKEEGDANLVTLSIENFLDARLENEKGDVSYRQWANLTLSQGYDVSEERREGRKKETFLPLCAEMTLRPSPNLDFFGLAKWDHYDHEINFMDLSLELSVDRSGNRKDTFNIDYLYEKDDQKSIDFWLDVNLAYGLSVGSSLKRDLDFDQNISNSYWLQYQRQCWGIKFIAEKEDEETDVLVVFQLLGLGDI
jgi:LPS-assembly protein